MTGDVTLEEVLRGPPVVHNQMYRVFDVPVDDSQPEVRVSGDVDAVAAHVWVFQVQALPAVPADAAQLKGQRLQCQ